MLLVAVTVLFCLLQILLWIDLNKSRRTHSDQVTVEPRSMFREILVDTADPIVLMLMGPFLKFLGRQVSCSVDMTSFYTTEMDHRAWRRRKQRPTSRRSSSSTPALWVKLTLTHPSYHFPSGGCSADLIITREVFHPHRGNISFIN